MEKKFPPVSVRVIRISPGKYHITFPERSVATGQAGIGRPTGGTNWNRMTGNAASCGLGGTRTWEWNTGKLRGSDPVVNGRSGPLFRKLLANSSQCIW